MWQAVHDRNKFMSLIKLYTNAISMFCVGYNSCRSVLHCPSRLKTNVIQESFVITNHRKAITFVTVYNLLKFVLILCQRDCVIVS